MSFSINDEPMLSGGEFFVKHKGKKSYSARLIIAHIADHDYIVLTPDGGLVREDLAARGTLVEIRESGEVPAKVGKNVIDFDAMPSQDEFDELVERAEVMVDDIIARRTDEAADSRPPGGYQTRSRPVTTGGQLTGRPNLRGGGGSGSKDGPVGLSGGLAALSAALGKPLGGGHSKHQADGDDDGGDDDSDVRVLPVMYDSQGMRFREFRDAVIRCEPHVWPDWPVPGPKTTMWVLKWMVSRGGTPLQWHSTWKANGRLQDSDATVLHHEAYCRVLETSLCYDQYNAAASAALELVCRQIQIAEDKLSHRFEDVSSDHHSDYYLMSGAQSKSQLCISPELKAWISSEVQKESSILKERRKAREERVLANPKRKGGKAENSGP